MKKFYLKYENRNREEKSTGYASYSTIINKYIDDLVLCNNIIDVDSSVYENLNINAYYYLDDEGNFRTEEEYSNDKENKIEVYKSEIYQYYLCNLSERDVEKLTDYGIILSYSELLDCNVLCVNHFGMSWDSISTDVELTENLEEEF